MNFDGIAPFYASMERFLAGPCMNQTRRWLMEGDGVPRKVLMVGEGPGTFLQEFLSRFPTAEVTVVDGSSKMLQLARRRVGDRFTVSFIHSMIGEWETDQNFDLIVTNFLLDCLPLGELEAVVAKLSGWTADDAEWWIAEFDTGGQGIARWRSRSVVRLLYVFFGAVAGVEAREIHPPERFLQKHGFLLQSREVFSWGLLKGERWFRGNGEMLRAGAPPS